MEEGSLRCDANISIRIKGTDVLNQRVEVKNMNSIRNVKRAIEYEFTRQVEAVEKGEKIVMETRNFDAPTGTTSSMRSKEMAHDYRYFPEPDLLPIHVSEAFIENIRSAMPALPNELKEKYQQEFGLSEYDASILTEDKYVSDYFGQIIQFTTDYKAAANWIIGPVKSYVNEKAIQFEAFPLQAAKVAELILLIEKGITNFSIASNKLFPALLQHPEKSAMQIAEEMNVIQSSDEGEIAQFIDEVLEEYAEKVLEFKSGKKGLMGLFVGEVMKKSGGKSDPKLTTKLLNQKLA
jgi:aspartyl-tRNA(Asn)/glutamyl-tRNA(Gln) amidotransferase subunit B